ncbi:hypothetical protein ABE65_010285 [Fictibacillus phosphorivorans]|uniref:Uncharacterized protein n=1 Tax=Fictibacillus phosphorivorans TaxID=1221500 RepID=A0A160IME8_9BACL|nr:hypothetical protein [Fictibacillus phosphorivorans]ANC77167.1 hypothetical protein ABE65_010285 [Fictibacillus phosphorivorans]
MKLINYYLNLLKFGGYLLLALFVYAEFNYYGAVTLKSEHLGITNDLLFEKNEEVKVGALMLSSNLIYTSIVLALLEALGNLLATFNFKK